MPNIQLWPGAILETAKQYGVSVKDAEYWLLDIVKTTLAASVPSPWRAERRADGGPYLYINSGGPVIHKRTTAQACAESPTKNRTGEQSQRHPNFENFQELIQCARQEGPPEDNLRRTLLSFPSGASQSVQDGFVFDFASQSRLDPASSACQDVNNFIQPCSWSAKLLRAHSTSEECGKGQDKDGEHSRGRTLCVSDSPALTHTATGKPALAVVENKSITKQPSAGNKLAKRTGGCQLQGLGRPPASLTFFTWWFEDFESSDLTFRDNGQYIGGGLRARHATLTFHPYNSCFDISWHDKASYLGTLAPSQGLGPLKLKGITSVTTCMGMPVQPWDLHVGGKLRVLGSAVVLRACSAATGRWLDQLAARLIGLKEAIVCELRKYSDAHVVRSLHTDRGKGGGRLQASYAAGIEQQKQGAVHLQAVADQLLTVADLLSAYRPKLAEEYKEKVRALRRVSRQPVVLAAPSGTPEDPDDLSVRRRGPPRTGQLQVTTPRPQSGPLDTTAFHALAPKDRTPVAKATTGPLWA